MGCDLCVGEQQQRLTQIEVDLLPLDDEPCKVTVESPGSNNMCTVGVYGLWCERLAYVYLERDTEEREAVAKVFRPDSNGDGGQVPFGEYHIQVAPGVDVAFTDDALQQALDKTT